MRAAMRVAIRATRWGRRDKDDAMRIIYKASVDQIGVSLHHRTILDIQLSKCIADLIGSTPLGGVRPLTTKALYYL
jgi:hypothetical protein